MIFVIPMYALMFVGMMCTGVVGSAGGDAGAGIAVLVFMVFLMVLVLVLTVGMILVLTPILIRAGLTQEFGEAFKFGWVKDFIGRTWKEMLIFALVMMVGSVVLGMIGMAVFCVGLLAAAALMMMAYAHMYYQLYELYLARGGEPVPMKEPAVV
jgi:hypothetical protein